MHPGDIGEPIPWRDHARAWLIVVLVVGLAWLAVGLLAWGLWTAAT